MKILQNDLCRTGIELSFLVFTRIMLLIYLFFFCVSCSVWEGLWGGGGEKSLITDDAPFIVEEIVGQVVPTRVNGLPEEIRITYKACFRDSIHPDNTLQNSLFKIHFFEDLSIRKNTQQIITESKTNITDPMQSPSDDMESENPCSESSSFVFSTSKKTCISIRTDSSGCLNWTEIYPYRFSNQSVWFHYERAFEGSGSNKGIKTISLAINPWLSIDPPGSARELQLVDLRYHYISKKGKLISLEESHISECRSCSLGKKKRDCDICQKKQRSLSHVISYFAQKTKRPRLWVNRLTSHINQQLISLKSDKEEHLEIFKKFNICHSVNDDNCDFSGRLFKVRLHIPLYIQVKNYRDENEYLPLIHGNYSIKVFLFLRNENSSIENITLHRDIGVISSTLEGSSQENSLVSEFYLHIPYEHYNLPAFLGVQVQPEGNLKSSILPFSAVFPFEGQLKSIIGSKNLVLDRAVMPFYNQNPAQDFLTANYVFYDSLGVIENPSESVGWRRAGWDVKLNRFRFSSVDVEENRCPTPIGRTVRYVGEVCIIDPLTDEVVPSSPLTIHRQNISFSSDNQPQEGKLFKISKINDSSSDESFLEKHLGSDYKTVSFKGKEDPLITDTSGCLQWVDDISHQWYNREKYFVRKMIFSQDNLGFVGDRIIAINPWQWGFLFFQDITQLGQDSIRTRTARVERPQVLLHDFRSQYIDLIYSIDRWLGINIFQNVSFLFKVRVDRPDHLSTGQGGPQPSSQDIRRGYYLLRFILVKSHTDESGGGSNMAVGERQMLSQDRTGWNTYTGFEVGKTGVNPGQIMNTSLEYITHFDTYVEVRDGLINAYINFLFELDEFIFIGSTNRLIVQLWPTDPAHYVYYEGTCKVNPKASHFVPFKNHDLVTLPFMGPFVPGEQRNWNIFRILSEYTNIKLPDTEDQGKITRLNMDVDHFIREGKKQKREDGLPTEYDLFNKLGAGIVFSANTDSWGDNALSEINTLAPILRKWDGEITLFLNTEPNDSLLSSFDDNKNKLIESANKIQFLVSKAIKGALESHWKLFFTDLQSLLNKTISILENQKLSPLDLKNKIKEKQDTLLKLVIENLSVSLSNSEEKQLLKKVEEQKKGIRGNCGKWLNPGISCPENPEEWSEFNMNLFAENEGLKLINVEDTLVDTFLDDLNQAARLHNKYYFHSSQGKEDLVLTTEETLEQSEESAKDELFHQMIEGRKKPSYKVPQEGSLLTLETHRKLAQEYQINKVPFWNNFELLSGDSYSSVDNKIRKMYLPNMTRTWLDTVVNQGIHSGTLGTPEVMTFLHSLCGFWFNHFYTDYLEQKQLDTIYLKHMDHYQYYAGTLDYLQHTENAEERHIDLLRSMEKYKLLPMDKKVLDIKKGSPFLVYDTGNSSSMWSFLWPFNREKETDQKLSVVQSIYENKDNVLKLRQQAHYAMAGGYNLDALFRQLESDRHPYFKCISNPLNFFHIEEKMIVGDIDDEHIRYEYGMPKSFNVQMAFDYSYSAAWSMSRSFSAALGTGFGFLGLGGGTERMKQTFLSPFNAVNPFFSFSGVSAGADWASRSSTDDSNRVQQSLRLAHEGLYLNVNHSVVDIRLKQYRKCVIVRAQNMAFDGYDKNTVWREDLEENFIHQIPYIKSGVMLCSEDKTEPVNISEDYYYMYQTVQGGLGQFQNIHSFRNRPFVISIRGRHEMEKFMFLINAFVEADKKKGIEDANPYTGMTNPYDTLPEPAFGTRKAIQNTKIWNKTGFYPGVYTVQYDREHYLFHNTNSHYFRSDEENRTVFEEVTKWLREHNPIGIVPTDGITTPMNDRGGGNY
ncbi:MAG: hypothetical protein OXM55_07210 [Bdellovibrionales bacterium]|nr:hypothetical protein [Bdellovibrionales bacterium]